ncbi:alpha/beta hydrolase [Bifidobacterium pullorum subsp. saeculare]|uniref:Alpha/beta hydrolase n=1 Tax=Bifidobacterium pullorum subsp. saeculare TaxID=78257 RepID=A0A938WZ84_9BIFI|nr:alpha/beta hydrolase [Bifidobacterium pullorum]MBM6700019.1 alpha/beta hydrolase [Bifidobacterium pullorum subsp. saeculare]
MLTFSQSIAGIDGTAARFDGYVLDNSPELDMGRRRPAVLILPGGAYAMTSDREAEPVAVNLLAHGFQAFVLRYSCAPSVFPTALVETAEAMRRIREHADEWHVDPGRIVVMGFSAGGHAAALFAEQWDGALLAGHGYEAEAIRPNGLALGYPVITSGPFAHRGSIDNLLGERKDDPQLLDLVCLERHVKAGTVPPTFIWTTATDDAVPAANTTMFVDALLAAGVGVEAHVFPTGRHGLSLGTEETADTPERVESCVQVWPDLLAAWIRGVVR